MWKELKELLKARVSKRPSARRAGLPCFRGRFEQLETRTVLSATIGVIAVDFESGVVAIAIVEDRPQLPPPPTFTVFHHHAMAAEGAIFGEAPWESNYGGQNRAFVTTGGGPGPFGFFGMNGFKPSLFASADGHVPDEVSKGGFFDPQDDRDGEVQQNGGAIRAQAPPETDSTVDPNVNDRQHSTFLEQGPPGPPPELPQFLSASLPSFSAVSEPADNIATTSLTSLDAQDAAFDEYSSHSLLLAASVDEDADDDGLLGDDEEERDADEEQHETAEESTVALVNDDVAESLDALEREQAAIDAVLAELHDLNLHQDEESTDAAQAHNQSTSKHAHDDRDLPTDDQPLVNSTFSQAEGGMVLLEATGDANRSAYDLTAVFTGQFTRPHDVALGLDANVGLQQAFDVGSNERLDTAVPPAPAAKNAASMVQPSVSAENAPVKKSEQPT